ncbi:hypothetical protein FH966_10660 [Lentibacillus cibarius]|uniref:GerAB/ArcD/ProY family transporter n=1 Tax=Lentibacillus cibarius TaxID=2583219 RepID=A0A549YJN5_9BACI|nr:hypothetical protein [Lentibacillus cibarius]TRM12107.1 hypothetical protein FH966_10660 [Lentibacillus cibarius]
MNRFFQGKYGRYFLPAIILQSVLIGGGFATGREIVEFGAKYGAMGWIAGIGIFVGFTVTAVVTFEFARKFKLFNYRSLLKELIGPFWVLFDFIYLLLAILIISIMASATGEIIETTLGLNYWVGVIFITVIVGILNFFGKEFIERFKSFGTLMLMIGYFIFAVLVISSTWQDAISVISFKDTSFVKDKFNLGTVLWSGILYVGYSLAIYPSALFTVRRQKSRKESVFSGLIAGILMTIPWFLTYFSILGFYPNVNVLGSSVPWLQMLSGFPSIIIVIFGVVVGWTLIETASGMIHAFIDRIDSQIGEHLEKTLTNLQKGIIAVSTLILSVLLSRIGIIDLISKGYTAMAYGMILICI